LPNTPKHFSVGILARPFFLAKLIKCGQQKLGYFAYVHSGS